MATPLYSRLPSPVLSLLALAVAISTAGGCATTPPAPTVLTVAPEGYGSIFDAALEVARRNEMAPVLRDRRGGLIETEPVTAPSLLEPWRDDGAALERRVEQTLSHERRRARFEFLPAGFDPPERSGSELTGADLLALTDPRRDLTRHDGPLELRVWVWVERASHRGLRRSFWTQARTTRSEELGPDGEALPSTTWTPVARDTDLERRLLAQVARTLDASAP